MSIKKLKGHGRTPTQDQIRSMVDRVIEAKFGRRYLTWLRAVRSLPGGVGGLGLPANSIRIEAGEVSVTG
jgi:hypothetical protein